MPPPSLKHTHTHTQPTLPRPQVMWFEGLIIAVVIIIALTVGCCCMHLVDVPTRFAQVEARREHAD